MQREQRDNNRKQANVTFLRERERDTHPIVVRTSYVSSYSFTSSSAFFVVVYFLRLKNEIMFR